MHVTSLDGKNLISYLPLSVFCQGIKKQSVYFSGLHSIHFPHV